jgi:beta-galactosidase
LRRTLLHDGWTVHPRSSAFEERLGLGPEGVPVTLPHDAMLGSARSPSGTAATAFYAGGEWEYRRSLERPRLPGPVYLEFEGVYRDALVLVNDNPVAKRPNGYTGFVVQIDHLLRDGENQIRVQARSYQDSRWYPGGGIYRPVWLLVAGGVHVAPGGVAVLTPEIDDEVAVVAASALVRNQSGATSKAHVRFEVVDDSDMVVASAEAPASTFPGDAVTVRQRLCVTRPRRWGPGHPTLYTCRVTIADDHGVLDEESTTFGIRSLSLDPVRGLRLNGEPVLLRGACVHHDSGPLGAATFDRAEERRVELLQAAGFNAIRSAHNPVSKAMLAACDRLGVLVMDEAFDMWEQPKTEHDYALHFAEWWESDVEAMVRKDINHPSVVLYSIGNEIPEAGRPHGSRRGRALAEKIRSLDPSRFVTEAVTGLLMGGPEMFDELRHGIVDAEAQTADAGGGSPNATASTVAERLNAMMKAPSVGLHSAESFSYLDVAGYNYMESRYELDGEAYPNRVIVGTETHAAAIDTGWAAVRRLPHVIGDFTWTGWDYLGEAGIGRTVYAAPGSAAGPGAFLGEYPWRTAWCGDIDITGHRRPQSYYREIVFGLRADPYVVVRRPEHHGQDAGVTPWSWTDTVSNWSWDGHEGAPVTVEVYADADEVELFVNGRSAGTRQAGAAQRFRAEFETVYEPGVLEAVARRGDAETGRAELRSAKGPVRLDVSADRPHITAHPHDLAFVALTLVDDEGVLHGSADRRVGLALEGPGILQALGSADPATEEGFGDTTCTTFDGRALAVIRPTGPGQIVVTVTADECDPQAVRIEVEP